MWIHVIGFLSLLFLVFVMVMPLRKQESKNKDATCVGCTRGWKLKNHVHLNSQNVPGMICRKSPVMRRA